MVDIGENLGGGTAVAYGINDVGRVQSDHGDTRRQQSSVPLQQWDDDRSRDAGLSEGNVLVECLQAVDSRRRCDRDFLRLARQLLRVAWSKGQWRK